MNKKIQEFINNRLNATKEIEQNLTIFGLFLIIAYPGFYFINSLFVTPEGYENLPLRVSIGLLGGILCLRNFWPQKCKAFLPAYMYFLLIYTLPFFFFFMLFNNPASNIWQLNTLVGLFLLFLFISWVDAIILSMIGYAAAYYIFTYTFSNALLPPDFFKILIVYISPLVYISLLFNQKDHIQKIKQQSLKMQAATIAHEMRTPLSAINYIAIGLKENLPTLINTQKLSQQNNNEIPFVNKETLQSLESLPETLEEVTKSASTVIDMLLMNLQDNPPQRHLEMNFISNFLKDSLHDYPLTEEERALVSIDIPNDFEIESNPHLLKHVFFNLLKNALYYIKDLPQGKIFIWTEKGEKVNKLYFKDTGKGISKDNLPYIFGKFYSRTEYGTGVGLAFCKMVMQNLGGDIICDSVEGEYTCFILTFPVQE